MTGKQDQFMRLRNHREVRALIESFADGADLGWFDRAAEATCKKWFRLAHQHLRSARESSENTRRWRTTVSRCYYAVYSCSKSIRYYVTGSVKLDADDHKAVGDLPSDFPNRAHWSTFTTELRRDRNLADYEPWDHVRKSLSYHPTRALQESESFLRAGRRYLTGRGVQL
jgi:hypothetical protein